MHFYLMVDCKTVPNCTKAFIAKITKSSKVFDKADQKIKQKTLELLRKHLAGDLKRGIKKQKKAYIKKVTIRPGKKKYIGERVVEKKNDVEKKNEDASKTQKVQNVKKKNRSYPKMMVDPVSYALPKVQPDVMMDITAQEKAVKERVEKAIQDVKMAPITPIKTRKEKPIKDINMDSLKTPKKIKDSQLEKLDLNLNYPNVKRMAIDSEKSPIVQIGSNIKKVRPDLRIQIPPEIIPIKTQKEKPIKDINMDSLKTQKKIKDSQLEKLDLNYPNVKRMALDSEKSPIVQIGSNIKKVRPDLRIQIPPQIIPNPSIPMKRKLSNPVFEFSRKRTNRNPELDARKKLHAYFHGTIPNDLSPISSTTSSASISNPVSPSPITRSPSSATMEGPFSPGITAPAIQMKRKRSALPFEIPYKSLKLYFIL